MTKRMQEYYYDTEGNLYYADMVLGETKDYSHSWNARLTDESDTLSTVTWTIPTGLTAGTESEADNVATIWLTADAVGTYECKCQVDTVDNGETQTYIRVFYIKVL